MTDQAQQGNNMSASAQGAPKPTGDKPRGTESERLSQGAPRAGVGAGSSGASGRAIGAPRTREPEDTGPGSSARAAFYGDHPQRSASAREAAREEPRGAGSGEDAKFARARSIIDWPPKPISHAQHVEELLEIAQENEDHNNRVNEEQTSIVREAAERIGFATYPLGDPQLEEESRNQVLDDYKKANDPVNRRERLQGEMDARAARDRKQVKDRYGDEAGAVERNTDISTRRAAEKDSIQSRARGAKEQAEDKVGGAK